MTAGAIRVGVLAAPANLSSALSRSLADMIRAGTLKPGDRLPTEHDLMRQAGVSRTVVREAVAALKAEGLVTTRQGVGAFVAPGAAVDAFRLDSDALESVNQALHIMELRIGIEAESAGLAAERRDDAALAHIEQALANFVRAVEAGTLAVETDFAFHRAIAAATVNPYFPKFLDFLGQIVIPRQNVHIGAATDRSVHMARLMREHHLILEAIRTGDVAAARAGMRQHLTFGMQRIRRLADEMERGASL